MLYRPSVPQSLWFTENGKPELRHGFIVNQQAFMGFLREAQTAHKEYSWDHRVAWAAYNAYTHPNHRPAWIWRLLTGMLTVLLLASCTFAEPPNREAIVRRIVEIVMATPQGPFGTPTLARMQIRSAAGAWVDLSATTGLPITCLSGCGGLAAFLDNAAFVAGLTPVGITAGWFSNSPTACTSGSACAPSLTSDRKLFVQSFQGTSPWVVSANGGTFAVTQSGAWTVTTTPPSNASTNLAQWAGNALGATSNYGTSPGAVAVPGVNAFITNIPAVTLTSTTITGTVAGNITQFGSTNLSTGTGAGGAGIPRVTVSNDSNVLATQSGTWTDRVVGNAGAAFDAANNAAVPANVIADGVETIAQGSQPTAATAGNMRRILATTEGAVFVQQGSSNRFSCLLQGVTVTTECKAAPGAGLRAYVMSVNMSNQAATVQTLDVVFGTGTNCATGTTALTHKFQFGTAATTTSPQEVSSEFASPLVPTAANAICVRPSAASAFGVTITGFVAP